MTTTETIQHLADDAANIARLLGGFKLLQEATPELRGFFHRAENVTEEFARKVGELLSSAPPGLRAKVDALAMPPHRSPHDRTRSP